MALRREGLLHRLERDHRQAERGVFFEVVAVDGEANHPVVALVGQIVADDLGDLAGAEDHHLAHVAAPASGWRRT